MRKASFVSGVALGLTVAIGIPLALGPTHAVAQANQPHMQTALDALGRARSELQAATANKGGHRVKALDLIAQAIGEVKAGIASAD